MRWLGYNKILLLCFLLPIIAFADVIGVRWNALPNKVQVVIEVDRPSTFQQLSLASPPRIVLDVAGANRAASVRVGQGAVDKVRTGARNGGTRVVIDLRMVAKANIYTLAPSEGRGNRIIVDVYENAVMPALMLTSSETAQSIPFVIFAGKALEDGGVDYSAQANMAKTTMPVQNNNRVNNAPMRDSATYQRQTATQPLAAKQPVMPRKTGVMRPQRDIIVVIDPGHGGKDSGAVSRATGLYEKTVTLQISKRLKRIINARSGFVAKMTREDDRFIELSDRPHIARRYNADLFISIHADSVESQQPKGSSVYILSTKGASSQLAAYLEKSENATALKWGVDVSRYDNDLQHALLDIQQESTIEASYVVGQEVLKELSKVGNVHKRYVERANFAVLRSPEIPSLLVETAFISNPEEARRLANPKAQEEIAQGIARGVFSYFSKHLPQSMLLER